MTTPQPAALPELLREIVAYCREAGHDWSNLAEAEHMLAALQSQPAAAGVSDAEIDDIIERAGEAVGMSPGGWDVVSPRDLVRAILALRQQSDSEARRAAQEQLYTERERHTAEVKRLQAEIGRLQSLRPQAVPMTKGTARQFVEWMKAQPEDREPTTIDGALAEFEAHHGITAPAGGEKQA